MCQALCWVRRSKMNDVILISPEITKPPPHTHCSALSQVTSGLCFSFWDWCNGAELPSSTVERDGLLIIALITWWQRKWMDSRFAARQLGGCALPCVCLLFSQDGQTNIGVLVLKSNLWFNWGLQGSIRSQRCINCASRFDLGSWGRIAEADLQPLPQCSQHTALSTLH